MKAKDRPKELCLAREGGLGFRVWGLGFRV